VRTLAERQRRLLSRGVGGPWPSSLSHSLSLSLSLLDAPFLELQRKYIHERVLRGLERDRRQTVRVIPVNTVPVRYLSYRPRVSRRGKTIKTIDNVRFAAWSRRPTRNPSEPVSSRRDTERRPSPGDVRGRSFKSRTVKRTRPCPPVSLRPARHTYARATKFTETFCLSLSLSLSCSSNFTA